MNGIVDEQLRALVNVPVACSVEGQRKEIAVWVGTAFNGGLVIPKSMIIVDYHDRTVELI